MKTPELASAEFYLWDICDYLAGSVDRLEVAHAFTIAAEKLADSGVNYWVESTEYAAAKQRVDEE